MLKNKILTWDNFLKRGGSGPNICIMCHMDAESVDHLMVHCSFTKSVWREVKNVLNIAQSWDCQSIYSCFQEWINKAF